MKKKLFKLICTKAKTFYYIPSVYEIDEIFNHKRWCAIRMKLFGIIWITYKKYSFYDLSNQLN